MQIDFHHGVTYVAARLAGFSHRQASTVAYCAQYVDDATNSGVIRFDTEAMYYRISSAHKMLDYRNFKALANHRVWIPFHFLPGNDGRPAGENPKAPFIKKIICRPDSHVARDMIAACIDDRDKRYGLHRLGICMHVYADTWAHQGFAGVNDKVNEAGRITGGDGKPAKKLMERLVNFFIGEALPLGHGTVLSYPDLPYLEWAYTNGRGERIRRNNPRDFLEAAEKMHQAMQRYRAGDPQAETAPLPDKDKKKIAQLLRGNKQKDGAKRHRKWLEAIAKGEFSFGAAEVNYVPKGKGSWKYKALGTKEWIDDPYEIFKYKDGFVDSDWKHFHDALQAHRFSVVHDILPAYGICAA